MDRRENVLRMFSNCRGNCWGLWKVVIEIAGGLLEDAQSMYKDD